MQMTKKSKSAVSDLFTVARDSIKKGEVVQARNLVESHPALNDSYSESGISLLMYAAYFRQADLVSFLAAKRPQLDLFEYCILGNFEAVKAITMANPGTINSFSGDGFTPLIFASFFGHLKLVEYLVSNGAELNLQAKNTSYVTPLHGAVSGNHFQIASFLLHKKAKVNVRQEHGRMPLHLASMLGNNNIVELLIEYGAHINVKTEDGKTPMTIATEKGFTETAEIIQSYGGKL